jgi:hypothetical protein
MKTCICLGFILMLATPLHAETYSWVDDSGTYNYTEDYSKVPKKYRKKVKRREDLQQDEKPQTPAVSGNVVPRQTDKTDAKTTAVPGDGKEMYGGKTRAAWRKEMDVLEAELGSIEQRMEQLRKQMYDPKGISAVKLDELKKDYDDNRATYDQKYRSYTELIEAVRKAGITVDIKK